MRSVSKFVGPASRSEFSFPQAGACAYILRVKKPGVLISFEGVDGSGKSTQARLLYEFLKKSRYSVVFIREPGGTSVSEAIRSILLNTAHKNMSPRAELLLFLASRAELVDEVIRPALAQGKIVITDRFSDSTLAYQVDGRRLSRAVVERTNDFASDRVKPDLTFVVDLEVQRAHSRLKARKDRMEAAAADFHRRVRRGFLKIAKADPKRVKVLDGRDTPELIFEQVLSLTQQHLVRRKIGPPRRRAQ